MYPDDALQHALCAPRSTRTRATCRRAFRSAPQRHDRDEVECGAHSLRHTAPTWPRWSQAAVGQVGEWPRDLVEREDGEAGERGREYF